MHWKKAFRIFVLAAFIFAVAAGSAVFAQDDEGDTTVTISGTGTSMSSMDVSTFNIEGMINPEDLAGKMFQLNAGVGLLNYNYKDPVTGQDQKETIAELNAYPTLHFEPVTVGLEVHALLASAEKKKKLNLTGKNPVILNFVEVKKYPFLVRWGALSGVTLGYGLIMNNYSTTPTQASAVFTNKDKGTLFQYTGQLWGGAFLGTQTHVYAGRVYYHMPTLLKRGVTFGLTYAQDGDEVDDLKAWGLDAAMPLVPKMTLYGQYAQLTDGFGNDSKAISFGADWLAGKFSWRNEYRKFGDSFKPGIFDSHYEVNSLQNRLTATKYRLATGNVSNNGFYSRLMADLAKQFKASAAYEKYSDMEPRFIAEAMVDLRDETKGMGSIYAKASYEQKNFRFTNLDPALGVVRAFGSSMLNENIEFRVNYTKLYEYDNAAGKHKPVETVNTEIRLKI